MFKLINYAVKEVHKYQRLKIEMDLIYDNLGKKFPELNILIDHLRDTNYSLDKLEFLEKTLEEHYGRNKSKDHSSNT